MFNLFPEMPEPCVWVTGSGSLIGQHVVLQLLQQGGAHVISLIPDANARPNLTDTLRAATGRQAGVGDRWRALAGDMENLTVQLATRGRATTRVRVVDPLQSETVEVEALFLQAPSGVDHTRTVRPAPLWGPEQPDFAGPRDMLGALLCGCIRMGAAPDVGWLIDACTPDGVGRAVAALCGMPGAPRSAKAEDAHSGEAPAAAPDPLYVAQAESRHWRDMVLWLHLYGYPLRLLPFARWCDLAASTPDAFGLRERLPVLRRSAAAASPGAIGPGAAAGLHARCSSIAWLRQREIDVPLLDDACLSRMVTAYVDAGWLLPVSPPARKKHVPRVQSDADVLREAIGRLHPDARVEHVEPMIASGGDSIMMHNTAIRHSDYAGLRPYRLRGAFVTDGREVPSITVMLKRKPHSDVMVDVVLRIADLADPETGRQFARAMPGLDITDCHSREVGVYNALHAQKARYVPRLWGTLAAPERQVWAVVIDFVRPAAPPLPDAGQLLTLAVRALVHLHTPWLRRPGAVRMPEGLGARRAAADKVAMQPFWQALGGHMEQALAQAVPAASRGLPARALAWLMPRWERADTTPQTLVHNDFALRNSFVVDGAEGPEICSYDWELAQLGAPQKDLLSWLCLAPGTPSRAAVHAGIEAHRAQLERATGVGLDAEVWWLGAQMALADLLVDRLAMIAMLHRLRPSALLMQALRNWWQLAEALDLPVR